MCPKCAPAVRACTVALETKLMARKPPSGGEIARRVDAERAHAAEQEDR
jgi:hypothetical protein